MFYMENVQQINSTKSTLHCALFPNASAILALVACANVSGAPEWATCSSVASRHTKAREPGIQPVN